MIGDVSVTARRSDSLAHLATPPEAFPRWLRNVMGRQGLSAGTLARRIGVPSMKVSAWVLGSRWPEDGEIALLADALGVTIAEARAALGAADGVQA